MQIHHFRKGLKEVLKDALVEKKMPITFPEFAAQCISLDNEIFVRIREKKIKISPPATSQPSQPPNALTNRSFPSMQINHNNNLTSDPMELDNSEAGKAARKAYRWANNLCGYCGKPGHKVASCPTLAARSSNSGIRVSNTEVIDKQSPFHVIVDESKN